VFSNDVSLTRLLPLRTSRRVVSDGRRPPFNRRFQTVLLDAPCSATGTIRKHPEIKWRLREQDIASFVALQRELLASALALATETVVYATCSLEPEENDAQIDTFLSENPSFVLDPPPEGTVAPELLDAGRLRVLPHRTGTDGAFAARLRRIN